MKSTALRGIKYPMSDELPPEAREYLRKIAAKGGKKKGPTKKRGGSKFYRDLVRARWEKKEKP